MMGKAVRNGWILLILGVLAACSKDPTPPEACASAFPDFATCVQPILNARCVVCHGSSGGLSLESGVAEQNLIRVPASCDPSMVRVAPGDPDRSLLYLKITDDPRKCGGVMPPTGPLPQEEAEIIRNWILSLSP